MRLTPSMRPGNSTAPPPAAPPLSDSRRRLADAIRNAVVDDPRGEKIAAAVADAEASLASAERELNATLEVDRANAERYFDTDAAQPRPDPNHVARGEAEKLVREAQTALALNRTIQRQHQANMAPAHERAQRAANQIPQLALGVLQEECEARIEELQHRMVVCNALSIQIEGLALLAKQLGDGGRHEGYRLFEVLRGRIKEAMRTLTPAEAFSPPMRQSIQAWMRADAALRADPAADIDSIITPTKGP